MITVMVTITSKKGSESEFENKLGELLQRVREEPGCDGVHWGPVAGEPGTYGIVERYTDEAALIAHQESGHMATYGPILAKLYDTPPSAIMFNDF
jgi:quinol monooxygenase YgiN